MIEIYENFLDTEYFNFLNRLVLDKEQPIPWVQTLRTSWFFLESTTYDHFNWDKEKDNLKFGFFHLVYKDGIYSEFLPFFLPITNYIKKTGIKIDNVQRIRLGLQVKVSEKNISHVPHTDLDIPHKTLLLYLNESDGDTIFYDNDFNEIKRVCPEKNKAIIFDGDILHSSSTPAKYQRRIAVNINFNLENSI